MCGIAGVIYRNGGENRLGRDMTAMLQSMRHRGPDSTGVALFQGGWAISQLWVFWVVPLLGGAVGGWIHSALLEKDISIDKLPESGE